MTKTHTSDNYTFNLLDLLLIYVSIEVITLFTSFYVCLFFYLLKVAEVLCIIRYIELTYCFHVDIS